MKLYVSAMQYSLIRQLPEDSEGAVDGMARIVGEEITKKLVLRGFFEKTELKVVWAAPHNFTPYLEY